MNKLVLLLSCEHAVNIIPDEYQCYFDNFKTILNTHEAIDFGALEIATYLQQNLHCELIQAQVSRILIDCNRSITHPKCFSKISQALSTKEKQTIIERYYTPFREDVLAYLSEKIKVGYQVLHLSVHSFTPVFHGITRQADIGILYDPKRASEKIFALQWQTALKNTAPDLRVRRNYPYQGISDGFTVALRKLFNDPNYIGIELEINQALVVHEQTFLPIKKQVLSSISAVISHSPAF
ncbi:MAG: N-formylglutamate amidohydrolase [Legionella sp.]|nr:N-formylglutamate amidohydrolase [Legionella sp.]